MPKPISPLPNSNRYPWRRQESPHQHRQRVCADLRRHRRAIRHQCRRCRCDLSGSSTAFTIADLSVVWIICDVYENDIPKIAPRAGGTDHAQCLSRQSTHGPHQLTSARFSIPRIRTAKVRIEFPIPGILKLGMFVTATFESRNKQCLRGRAVYRHPASARS